VRIERGEAKQVEYKDGKRSVIREFGLNYAARNDYPSGKKVSGKK
jgi:hypothetical protein